MFRVVFLGRRRLVALLLGIAALTLTLVGFAGAASGSGKSYPREQSLITRGIQWGDIQDFNPYFDNYAVGTIGLCNETLLRYDPLTDKYINWLAKSAKFSGAKVYTVEVRPGIKWSNGQAFTGRDVAFNFKLGRFQNAFWHDQYGTLKSIKVKGLTVTFTFKGTPDYAQWQHLIWNLPMVNPGQAQTIRSAATLESYGQQAPIGTGPYTLASLDPTTRVVWKKKAVWWAAQQKLAPSPKPPYVIDLVSGDCNLATLCCGAPSFCGITDLDNTYVPGINRYVASGELQTYLPKAPYNLSANTVWLTPNTKHKPLDDKIFRRVLATSIDVDSIVTHDYHDLVIKANATGLLPTWKKWVDQKELKSLGFSYDAAKAKSLLTTAGYRDVNGDGYVENKDGSPINLKISVPSGWSDWETAEGIIVNSAKAAGIRITIDMGDFNHYLLQRNSGAFDLVIDDTPQIGDNPWTYFDFLFHLPIFGTQTSTNFSRYKNKAAWKLVVELDQTPLDKTATRMSLMSRLEKIELTEVPNIPLWYSGVWSVSQSKFWANWPSSDSKRNYFPTMARGYMQMTGIDMITHLEPA
jgi:peptide/nickel transport system substrate-binding protein